MIPVIYSLNTGRVRRWMVDPDRTTMEAWKPALSLMAGEAVTYIKDEDYGDLSTLQSLVTQATGKTPSDDRYVVAHESGDILSVAIVDPAVDKPPLQCEFVKSKYADTDWTFNKPTKKLIPPITPVAVVTPKVDD